MTNTVMDFNFCFNIIGPFYIIIVIVIIIINIIYS